MKIGVISDTHIPGAATFLPPAIFDIFHGVDLILHAGDIVSLSVLDELRTIAPVEAVAGNVDDDDVQKLLPFKKIIPVSSFSIGLIHGKYRIDIQRGMIRQEFGRVDLIVYGHSHMPFWGKDGDMLFLNPGSPTDKRHAPYNSVALLTAEHELTAEIIRL